MRRAIEKYGWENIRHEVILSDLNAENANDVERFLIKLFHTNEPEYGYNITAGGDGYSGTSHKETTKEILREKACPGRDVEHRRSKSFY